jgi:hypothetical protein
MTPGRPSSAHELQILYLARRLRVLYPDRLPRARPSLRVAKAVGGVDGSGDVGAHAVEVGVQAAEGEPVPAHLPRSVEPLLVRAAATTAASATALAPALTPTRAALHDGRFAAA